MIATTQGKSSLAKLLIILQQHHGVLPFHRLACSSLSLFLFRRHAYYFTVTVVLLDPMWNDRLAHSRVWQMFL
jgi:hypothetical protein